MAFFTVFLARKAQINVASVTIIWSSSPLFLAILDYFIFKNKLSFKHILGISCLITCAFFISISSLFAHPKIDVPQSNSISHSFIV
jgi:drug/metabolite transporter (DMT)-like permease